MKTRTLWKNRLLLGAVGLIVLASLGAANADWKSADTAERSGKLTEALQQYADVEKSSGSVKTRSDAANRQGLIRMKLRQWDAAIADFERAVTIDPTKHALNNLGTALIQTYSLGKGTVTHLKRAVEVYDQLDKVEAGYKKENREEAIQLLAIAELDDAIAKGLTGTAAVDTTVPENADYKTSKDKGDKLMEARQFKAACLCFDRMAAKAPSAKTRAAAYNRKGLASIRARQYQEAVAALERAVSADPTSTIAWKNYGYSLRQSWLSDVTAGADLVTKARNAFEKAEAAADVTWADETIALFYPEVAPKPTPETAVVTPAAP